MGEDSDNNPAAPVTEDATMGAAAAEAPPIWKPALKEAGWAFNDVLRWHWRIEQLIDTHERYAGLPLEERIRNNDIRCARFPEDCAAHLLPYF